MDEEGALSAPARGGYAAVAGGGRCGLCRLLSTATDCDESRRIRGCTSYVVRTVTPRGDGPSDSVSSSSAAILGLPLRRARRSPVGQQTHYRLTVTMFSQCAWACARP